MLLEMGGAIAIGIGLCFSPPTSVEADAEVEPPVGTPAPTATPPPARAAEGPELPRAPEPSEPVARENWNRVVAGDVLVGVGMGGFGVMVAGLAIRAQGGQELDRIALRDESSAAARDEAEARISLGNQLAIAGGVSAGVLVASGVALIVSGHRRERLRRQRSAQVGAWGGANEAGLSLRARF